MNKFNSLTVINKTFRKTRETKTYFVKCLCDCGKEVEVNHYSVKSGKIKSCGCEIYNWKDMIFYEDEIWKIFPLNNEYEISSYGKAKVINTGKILLQHKNRAGYLYSNIKIKGKNKAIPLHRAVAITYIDNINNFPTVDHIDRNKENNRIDNLRWTNQKIQVENKNINNNSKVPVLMIDKDTGNILKRFDSLLCAGLFVNPENINSFKNISQCITGKSNTAYGYKWEYEYDNTDKDNEIWKDYFIDDRLYSISNYGRVKNKNRILKCHIRRGYITFSGKYVHRLVAELFLENPNNLSIVNHKDNNGTNNHVDNLEWVTQQENVIHSVNNGHRKNIKKVIHIDLNGDETIYNSCNQAALSLNIIISSISKCCRGIINTCGGGHKFKFLEE